MIVRRFSLLMACAVAILVFPPAVPRVDQLHPQAILFSWREDDSQHYRIYKINKDGTEFKTLTSADIGNADHPTWSPDGKQIAFDVTSEDDRETIYAMDAHGDQLKAITDKSFDSSWPQWSPDGKKILMMCVRSKDHLAYQQICTENPDGSNFQVLTSENVNWQATWSPDGEKIAFVSFRDGSAQIYMMNRDGSHQTRLTDTSISKTSPVWSPTRKIITFTGQQGETRDIYSIDIDKVQTSNVTQNGISSVPVWAPNGHYLAFHMGDELGIIRFEKEEMSVARWSDNSTYSFMAWSPDATQLAYTTIENPKLHSIYIFSIGCMFEAKGCTNASVKQLKLRVKRSSFTTDRPAFLNWAYAPLSLP